MHGHDAISLLWGNMADCVVGNRHNFTPIDPLKATLFRFVQFKAPKSAGMISLLRKWCKNLSAGRPTLWRRNSQRRHWTNKLRRVSYPK